MQIVSVIVTGVRLGPHSTSFFVVSSLLMLLLLLLSFVVVVVDVCFLTQPEQLSALINQPANGRSDNVTMQILVWFSAMDSDQSH